VQALYRPGWQRPTPYKIVSSTRAVARLGCEQPEWAHGFFSQQISCLLVGRWTCGAGMVVRRRPLLAGPCEAISAAYTAQAATSKPQFHSAATCETSSLLAAAQPRSSALVPAAIACIPTNRTTVGVPAHSRGRPKTTPFAASQSLKTLPEEGAPKTKCHERDLAPPASANRVLTPMVRLAASDSLQQTGASSCDSVEIVPPQMPPDPTPQIAAFRYAVDLELQACPALAGLPGMASKAPPADARALLEAVHQQWQKTTVHEQHHLALVLQVCSVCHAVLPCIKHGHVPP
jgi:hypothetical protein